jgi:hypothetical protein
MVNGFFKTVGYISTKVQNINNSKKIINPTVGFIKSLDEGYNLAKLEMRNTSVKSTTKKKSIKKRKSIKKKKPIKKKK